MADQSPDTARERVLQRLHRMSVDPDVTFIGRCAPTGVVFLRDNHEETRSLILWVAQHAVVPGQPQARGLRLVPPEAPSEAIIESFFDAVLPEPSRNLAPILPGKILVSDPDLAAHLTVALRAFPIDIAIFPDAPIFDLAAYRVLSELHTGEVPLPLWEAPVEAMRALATAAANTFRREPWGVLTDMPPVRVAVAGEGGAALWLASRLEDGMTPQIVAFFSLADYHRAGRAAFVMDALGEVAGDLDSLDLPEGDIALARDLLARPESALGDALVVTYVPLASLEAAAASAMRAARMPTVGRDATAPIFVRVARDGWVRRPTAEEARRLTTALDAFNAFFLRAYDRLTREEWHFGPVVAEAPVRTGAARGVVRVSLESLGDILPATRHEDVLVLRVYLADVPGVWRELEVVASQPTDELEGALRDAFDWPISPDGIFLPRDLTDGDDTYESVVERDLVSGPQTPIGLLLRAPRDFCHYLLDPDGANVTHLVRLTRVAAREADQSYPRLTRSHGEVPPDLARAMRAAARDEEFDDEDDDDDITLP